MPTTYLDAVPEIGKWYTDRLTRRPMTPEVEESGESGSEADVGEASGAATKPDDFISVHSSPLTTQSCQESDSDSSSITIVMNTQADSSIRVIFNIQQRPDPLQNNDQGTNNLPRQDYSG